MSVTEPTTETPPPSPPRRRWGAQALQTGLGMGIFQVLTFLSGILIARGLGAELQGKFQLMISVVTFSVMLAKLGLDEGISYLIPKYETEKPSKVFGLVWYSLLVSLLASLLLGGLYAAFAPLLEAHLFKVEGFANDLRYSLALMPAIMLLLMGCSALRGLGRSDLRAYIYYYGVAILFLGLLAGFSLSGLTLSEAYYARIGASGGGALLILWWIARRVPRGEWRLDRGELCSLHAFSGMLIFVSMFQYVVEQPLIDLILVGRYATAEDVGIYSVAARVGALVAIIPNALTIVMAPALSRAAAERDPAEVKTQYLRASQGMARLSLFLGGGLFFMRTVALGLFGQEYVAGEAILVIFMIGQVAVGLLGVNTPLLLSSGFARVEMILTGAAAALMTVGGIVLGQMYGSMGVALATVIATLLLALARKTACAVLMDAREWRYLLQPMMAAFVSAVPAWLVSVSLPQGGWVGPLLSALTFALVYGGISLPQLRGALRK